MVQIELSWIFGVQDLPPVHQFKPSFACGAVWLIWVLN